MAEKIRFVAICSTCVLALLAGPVTACAPRTDSPPSGAATTVLYGFTLIDGTGRHPVPDAYIVIEDGLIADVGAGPPPVSTEATRRDLSGRYVVPGFVDTHFHVDTPPSADQEILSMALGFGITSIRDTGPARGKGVTVRERIASGELIGPRMKTTGITIDAPVRLDPSYPVVTSVDEIQAEVRRQVATGADGIKLYMWLGPELVRAGVEEAHANGAFAVGHLLRTSWTEAAAAGIDVLVHSASEGPTWELLPGLTREVTEPGDWKASLLFWAQHANEIDLEGPQFRQLVATLVENDVEVNPTLVLIETLINGDDPRHLRIVEPQYAHAALQAHWGDGWQQRNPFMELWQLTPKEFAKLREAFPATLRMIDRFHRAGVRLTAGSDVSMPWIAPGTSLHRELYLLNQAGIPAADVLVIATRNGAEALGVLEETGTIEPGKSADLVVLSRDPLSDITNTRSIELVMFRGQEYASYRKR